MIRDTIVKIHHVADLAKASRGKRASLQMIDDFGIDKKELDKILKSINAIGNINPILTDELNIILSGAAVQSNDVLD